MRILHISNYYYPDIGGIECTARDCVNSLREGNIQHVFCFSHKSKNRFEEVEQIPVTRAGSIVKISSQSLSLSYGRLLKREIKNFSPDVIIFHYPNPFAAHFLFKQLKRKKNIKLILWWHLDITKQKILGKFFRGQTKRLIKRAEKIIATSPNYVEGSPYLSSAKQKCTVISSCVSPDALTIDPEISERAEKIREENAGKIILFALGRHVPYKGMEYLVRASKLLDDDYAIYIGGEGPLTKELKQLAKGDEKVHFLGRIDDETRKAYLLSCDIFCFPSITKNEAFGLALCEALAYGKPAVTFTIPGSGVNYVSLNRVTGIEVENRNVEQYARAIQTLAQNPELREQYGSAGRKRVYENFTFEIFSQDLRSCMAQMTEEEK